MSDELGIPMQRMSEERFEQLLLEIRNAANVSVVEGVLEGRDATTEDARAVWHAAEVALGILRLHSEKRYIPKREAMEDVRQLLAWYDED